MAKLWLNSCILALVLASISALIWHEDGEIPLPQIRLVIAAVAAFFLLRKGAVSLQIRNGMLHSIALASVIAFIWTAYLSIRDMDVRDELATNAIPWAVATSFYACLLLPAALAERTSIFRRRFWLVSVACAIGAILLTQSRGAFLVLPWCVLVYWWFWHKNHNHRNGFHLSPIILIVASMTLLAGSWWAPGDVLRIRAAVNNVSEVLASENYNSSIGARIYLWDMAWEGIKQSPWIGIGSTERIRRVKQAGDGGPPEELAKLSTVRRVSHIHNQYLNDALDGGIIGLASQLALLAGLALTARRLASIAPYAGWQCSGVLFMHATASITNVNFGHNYYMMALSLAAVVPLLCATTTANARPS